MLNKQNLKMREKAKQKGATKDPRLVLNQGEFLDRKKQRFDLSDSILPEGDFEAIVEKDDNPEYSKSYNMLIKRKDQFLLTLNDDMIGSDDESSDEGDND